MINSIVPDGADPFCEWITQTSSLSSLIVRSMAFWINSLFLFLRNTQCSDLWHTVWKFLRILLSLRFYVKINLAISGAQKMHFLPFWSPEIWLLKKFHIWKCGKLTKFLNYASLKWSKWHLLKLKNHQILISSKIWVIAKLSNHNTEAAKVTMFYFQKILRPAEYYSARKEKCH